MNKKIRLLAMRILWKLHVKMNRSERYCDCEICQRNPPWDRLKLK